MTNAGTPNDARLDRQTWRRFVVAVGNFASSEVRGRAAALAAAIPACLYYLALFTQIDLEADRKSVV